MNKDRSAFQSGRVDEIVANGEELHEVLPRGVGGQDAEVLFVLEKKIISVIFKTLIDMLYREYIGFNILIVGEAYVIPIWVYILWCFKVVVAV